MPDIARPGAFDDVVKTPGLEVVVHTASPFHFNISMLLCRLRYPKNTRTKRLISIPPDDPQKDLIDPAVNGTTGLLRAVARSAPAVRRVVVTSSFAAILDAARLADPATTFTEASWNPVTLADIHAHPSMAYRASKTLAERAAWDFVQNGDHSDPANNEPKPPTFDLVTVNPPLVFGPVVHHLASLDSINTSNERIVALVQGRWRTPDKVLPDTGNVNWVDVRDVAEAHVAAVEQPGLGGRRLFATAGVYSNRAILDIVRRHFPELRDKLPAEDATGGDLPPEDKMARVDNSETTKALGVQWRPLETTIVDTVNSLKPFLN